MLKKLLLTLVVTMFLTSCGETKFAEQYASRMAEVLKTYRDQIDTRIAAEQQSYVDAAKIYDAAKASQVHSAVLNEQIGRTLQTTDRLMQRKSAAPTQKAAWLSDIHSDILRFAEFDFQRSQPVFTRELTAYKTAIGGLADLTAEQSSLDKLQEALESLANPKSIADKLKASAAFGCEVNRNYQLLDVTQKIDELTKKISVEHDPGRMESLGEQQSDLENLKKKLEKPCKPA